MDTTTTLGVLPCVCLHHPLRGITPTARIIDGDKVEKRMISMLRPVRTARLPNHCHESPRIPTKECRTRARFEEDLP
ncbi:hypothetical protein BDV40DRAFT_255552 [Aspergillus tamarii]|uniref:Uncharacterized protein n=1 Tax=Aspergillus tamarii TaxID=41984 RepID=A0A5N6V6H8_ASPTM|nr:hypothetical protein BDV40DRAFT_255552 [Aspergillus tamarii]